MLKTLRMACVFLFVTLSVFFILSVSYEVRNVLGGVITGTVAVPSAKHKKDCVVYIENVPGNWSPTKDARIDQRELVFIPLVLPVVVNTTVEFLNHDNVLHNVFSPDKIADKFNLGTWPPGEIKTFTFQQIGSAALLCNVHTEMEGYVVVLQNPFFALTDKNGSYTIGDVPAGKYTLKVWNKKYKGEPMQIEVKDENKPMQVNLELKK